MSVTRHVAMLALAVTPSLGVAQETPSDTLLTVGHFFDLEQVNDPQISPDGSQIVYSRRWVNKLEDKYETTLYIMKSDGTRNRVFAKGSSPQWSPDGTRIAYLADGEPKGSQIYVRYVDGDPGPTQVTHLTEMPADIHWSPDGKSIGFTMFVAKPVVWAIDMPKAPDSAHWTRAPRIVETLHFREDRRGFQDPGFRHLFVASVDGGPARQITHGDWNVGSRFDGLSGPVGWDWTPEGKSIILDGWDAPDGDYQYRASNLYAVDPNTGATHVLTADKGSWHSPVVSPDGKHIAYAGYASTEKTYHTSGLYVMDIDGKNARQLSESLDRDAGDIHWASDNTGIYFAAEDHGARNVFFAPLAGAVRPITSGPILVGLGSISKTGVAALTRSTMQRPADVARLDLKVPKSEIVQLTHVNDAALARIHLGSLEEINYTSSGGAKIQGWVVKPPNFDPSKKYPLIMEIHGGPHGMYNVAFNYMFQNFAANDFVVIYVNPRGSTGYGSAFGAAISKAYPGVDYDDLMAGIDTVVARGYVDTKRMYVGGCSGGGVLSSWVIGHTTRFAAAAVRCPVIDWISMTGETDIPFFTVNWFDKPFWEDPEPWLKESPLMYVGHVTTPTLIMTGELDRRTPMPQSEEYYVALKMRHIPTTLLRFEGEFHGTGGQKPTNFIRTQLYMMSWYKRYSTPSTAASTASSP
ncbi:MAG TPA: S9 family peptidase [Gemmatimonadaceae bacterium]|nr:S9 family peptidase [Gemmatimonadaceae bacterium]